MMNHRGTEDTKNTKKRGEEGDRLTQGVIGAAIEVHRILGPGLLESVYQSALECELRIRGLELEVQKPIPVRYKGTTLGANLIVDLIVESRLLLELKAVRHVEPVHAAQILTYLRLTGIRLGLLLNFHASTMRQGIRRFILD